MAKQSSNNVIEQTICPTKLSSKCDKKYKKNTLSNVGKAINSLFNSDDGGTLKLGYNSNPPRGQVRMCKRKIEQKIQECLGTLTLAIDIHVIDIPASSHRHGMIKIVVNTSTKANIMSTMKYNLFYPSSEQVMEVLPTENIEKLRAVLMENIHLEKATEPGSHKGMFVEDETVDFSESNRTQFKKVKDEPNKRTTFTSRFTGNGNKFTCTVSAFANFAGGHIYIGINDDGKVEGEHLNEEEKKKAEKMIGEKIENMIWPEKWKPKSRSEEKRWNVHFVPVRDSAGNEIQSLYVVVVYVAQCPGGVFTEAPECYEIVNNEVKKVDFARWKKSIVASLATEEEACNADDLYNRIYENLTSLLNENCNKEELDEASKKAQNTHTLQEVELICLFKSACYHLRKGELTLAEESIKKYATAYDLLSITNTVYFKVIQQYLHCVMQRCKGNCEESYDIANKCLEDLRKLSPCLISAAFYIQLATLENILAMKAKTREEMKDLSSKAEENYNTAKDHLNNIKGHSNTKAEFEQKIYINKALLYLGCSLTGDMLPDSEELIDIEKAETHLKLAGQLSKFREIQYLIAKACLSYRSSMSKPLQQRTELLKEAVRKSKIAEYLALDNHFPEMTTYVKRYVKFFKSKQRGQTKTLETKEPNINAIKQ